MSLYIQVQINYVNLQGNYDTVLNNATYDAIKAFQINELNSTTHAVNARKININTIGAAVDVIKEVK